MIWIWGVVMLYFVMMIGKVPDRQDDWALMSKRDCSFSRLE